MFTELPHVIELVLRVLVVAYVSVHTMAFCVRSAAMTKDQAALTVTAVAGGAVAFRIFQKGRPQSSCPTCNTMKDTIPRSMSGRLSLLLQLEVLLATVYVLLAWCRESSIDTAMSWTIVMASVVMAALAFRQRADVQRCKDCTNVSVNVDFGLGRVDVGSCKGPRQ